MINTPLNKWNDKLTVMTKHMRDCNNCIVEIKNVFLRNSICSRKKSSGPNSVFCNLVNGLEKIGVDYNYNPFSLENVGDSVVVLRDIKALKQAIQWKRNGRIKRLFAGPNVAMLPSEITSLPSSNKIDIYLHPCQWVINWWNSIDPEFPIKQHVWVAGVDTEFWQSPLKKKSRQKSVLIYKKKCPDEIFQSCIRIAKSMGLDVFKIRYGSYSIKEYKAKLGQVDFVIYLSESESQGIALFESWSCNIPTLVWDRGFFKWEGYSASASSAPYLTNMTGHCFSGAEELEQSIQYMLDNLDEFQPRSWVLKYGSDEVSARCLLKILNGC